MAPLTNIKQKECFYDLHQDTFLEYSGHLSTGGNPAASTSVGMMSTNSTILSVTLVENVFLQIRDGWELISWLHHLRSNSRHSKHEGGTMCNLKIGLLVPLCVLSKLIEGVFSSTLSQKLWPPGDHDRRQTWPPCSLLDQALQLLVAPWHGREGDVVNIKPTLPICWSAKLTQA